VTVTRVGVSAGSRGELFDERVRKHTSLARDGCDERGDAEEDGGRTHVDVDVDNVG
jgi:hypothetical protein